MCLGRCKVFDYMVNNLAVSISHSGGDWEFKTEAVVQRRSVKKVFLEISPKNTSGGCFCKKLKD